VKATIDAASLRAAADWAAKHTGSSLPILSAVVVEAVADLLICSATDYDIWAEQTADAHVITAGRVAVSGRLLKAVTAALPEGRVDLDADDTSLRITAGRVFRATLPGLAAEDSPARPPAPAAELAMPVGLGRLLAAVAPVAESMERQSTDKAGLEFVLTADGLTVATTDRYRLITARLPWPKAVAPPERTLPLPASAVKALAELAADDDLLLGLPAESDSVISAAADTRSLACRVMAMPMVEWARLIPTGTPARSLVCDAAALAGLVKRLAPTISDREEAKEQILRVVVGGGMLTLTTDSAADAVEVDHTEHWDADAWQMAVKAPYLLSVIEAADSERVRIDFTKPNAAWLVTRPGSTSYRALVMPVRL